MDGVPLESTSPQPDILDSNRESSQASRRIGEASIGSERSEFPGRHRADPLPPATGVETAQRIDTNGSFFW